MLSFIIPLLLCFISTVNSEGIADVAAGSPSSSPIERSNRTIYNDGALHIINSESTSFDHETIIVTDESTLHLKEDGYIIAPTNSDGWPAIRLSIGGIFNGTGGSVTGSLATTDSNFNGGEAIEMYNGQSSPDTASFGHFYDGISVKGGDAPDGIGGNALHVHGFGTEAFIYGGTFSGGEGANGDDGLSINVLNSATVHIYSGSFNGEMEVGDSSTIAFYGCFMKNDTANTIAGTFVDETYLEVKVRERNGGRVDLISVSEQECDTAPSTAPTNFPTLSPQPTIPRPNDGSVRRVICSFSILATYTLVYFIGEIL